ncbi:hypothetical protein PR048_004438 [Dryococelus australis]|uniref:Uncharacterized protein n=1 Tax=Dryococelus australis TaxID=614101 RepID=A0ABQ9I5G6_9NEOP|nr:hypothetical protein PR048_004438 [Dryococelus australis]
MKFRDHVCFPSWCSFINPFSSRIYARHHTARASLTCQDCSRHLTHREHWKPRLEGNFSHATTTTDWDLGGEWSGEIWTALNIEVLTADERAKDVSMERCRNARAMETGEPRESPPANSIVRHDSQMRKCKSDPAGNMAERLACSPPTKANRVLSPAGSHPNLRVRESWRTMPLVGGISRGSPVFPTPSFRRGSILTSITPSTPLHLFSSTNFNCLVTANNVVVTVAVQSSKSPSHAVLTSVFSIAQAFVAEPQHSVVIVVCTDDKGRCCQHVVKGPRSNPAQHPNTEFTSVALIRRGTTSERSQSRSSISKGETTARQLGRESTPGPRTNAIVAWTSWPISGPGILRMLCLHFTFLEIPASRLSDSLTKFHMPVNWKQKGTTNRYAYQYGVIAVRTAAKTLTSHQGEPISIPGEIYPDFRMPLIGGSSRGSPVSSRPCIPTLLRTHLASPYISSQDTVVYSHRDLFTLSPTVHFPKIQELNKRNVEMTFNRSVTSVDLVDVYRNISRFLRPFIPAPLHTHLASPSSALKTSVLRAAQILSLTHSPARRLVARRRCGRGMRREPGPAVAAAVAVARWTWRRGRGPGQTAETPGLAVSLLLPGPRDVDLRARRNPTPAMTKLHFRLPRPLPTTEERT